MLNATVLTVTQLNRYVKSMLDSDQHLQGVLVQGEISNFTRHYKSGHCYFTLKDGQAAVKAVMFRGNAAALRFAPADGMRVIASGSVSLYERDGSYQLYVTDLQPDGVGALYLAYEQLKNKLAKEGLFDQARKRPLPAYPQRIGIVTSQGAAALQDMLNILSRRWPVATVVLCPAKVQGEGAAASIGAALRALDARGGCDVIIVGRGGGSMEDLWAFNDEALARTIAASATPVVSAVGHETDFTIADFAADLRAPTPSAAAELVAPKWEDVRYGLDALAGRCQQLALDRLEGWARRLRQAEARLATPRGLLEQQAQRVAFLAGAARERTARRLWEARVELDRLDREARDRMGQKLEQAAGRLERLAALAQERSPMTVLSRGYALAFSRGRAVTSAGQVRPGDPLETRVRDGVIFSQVTGGEERQE